MEMLENYMVTDGAKEWERMNAETAYDKATFPQMESYLFDTEKAHEVVTDVCGLDSDDMTEEVAVLVYDHLNQEEVTKAVEKWFAQTDAAKYDAWAEARYGWDE